MCCLPRRRCRPSQVAASSPPPQHQRSPRAAHGVLRLRQQLQERHQSRQSYPLRRLLVALLLPQRSRLRQWSQRPRCAQRRALAPMGKRPRRRTHSNSNSELAVGRQSSLLRRLRLRRRLQPLRHVQRSSRRPRRCRRSASFLVALPHYLTAAAVAPALPQITTKLVTTIPVTHVQMRPEQRHHRPPSASLS